MSDSCENQAKAADATPGPPKHAGLTQLSPGKKPFTLFMILDINAGEGSKLTRPIRRDLSVHSLTHSFNRGAFGPQARSRHEGVGLQVFRKERCVGFTPHCHSLNRGTWFVASERKGIHWTLQKCLLSLIMPKAMAGGVGGERGI